MKEYVAGLQFSEDLKTVTLIQKQRPEWQKNLCNGVGGHIEPGESAIQAMVREFKEETGAVTQPGDWEGFCVLYGDDWSVAWFRMFKNLDVATTTDEEIFCVPVSYVYTGSVAVIPNLKWLVPLALDRKAKGFVAMRA